ncbi:hypothetical protein L1887_48242 [Cichorium endivia]|nr:hypothetical protein L1887_48242 [Cichorium endivia]
MAAVFMRWCGDKDEGIKAWFFPRSATPADITAGHARPDRLGNAAGKLACTELRPDHVLLQPRERVQQHPICGGLGGRQDTLEQRVERPGAELCPDDRATPLARATSSPKTFDFSQAYWLINSVKIYQTERTY